MIGKKASVCLLMILFYALLPAALPAFAGTEWEIWAQQETGTRVSYGQTASDEEQVNAQEVGVEGMRPIRGDDVEDGVYEVTVESSSSMFRVEKACLTVEDHVMTADLTLSGTGYLVLFMGTGQEAAAAEESAYIGYEEGADGKYTYTVPVEALDQPIACAAFSKKKEKWYDRQILFQAESLPKGAVLVPLPDYEQLKKEARQRRIQSMGEAQEESVEAGIQPADTLLEDGKYSIDLEFQGGTGRTKVVSPAVLTVREGKAWAKISFTSPHYDYAKVGEETYLPEHTADSSVFEIPVEAFDRPVTVIGDTTAMSTPHEVEYRLTFYLDSVEALLDCPTPEKEESGKNALVLWPWILGAVLAAAGCKFLYGKKRDGRGESR